MSDRVNPNILREMLPYGGETISKCFNCGNCTAVCGHTDEAESVPRHFIRYMQLGLSERMDERARSLAVLLLRRLLRHLPARSRSRRS